MEALAHEHTYIYIHPLSLTEIQLCGGRQSMSASCFFAAGTLDSGIKKYLHSPSAYKGFLDVKTIFSAGLKSPKDRSRDPYLNCFQCLCTQ